MDVISLYENNIKTAVAPLGTSLTESQLELSWRYVKKPTIMFDGDTAGLRAAYKSALMSLQYLTPNKYLQFITLPKNFDPDSFINNFSLSKFITILKKPKQIVNFIFEQSSSTIDLSKPDNKVTYDKYIDDLIETIKDKKIKYFYKSEFKNLFFEKIKNKKNIYSNNSLPTKIEPLIAKEINSFMLSYLNHKSIRDDLYNLFFSVDLLDQNQINFIKFLHKPNTSLLNLNEILKLKLPDEVQKTLENIQNNSLFQLFPYAKKDYDPQETLIEIKESIKNLNTRLSYLKKINKSLNKFEDNSSLLTWEELKNISTSLHSDEDTNLG